MSLSSMGRKRDRATDGKLPPYVRRHRGRNRVIYQPYHRGEWGKCVTLRDPDGNPLTADSPIDLIYRAYSRLEPDRVVRTLEWLIDRYLESPQAGRLAPRTLEAYRGAADRISNQRGTGGRFGEVPLAKLKRRHFIAYHELRSKAGPVAANLDIQFLRSVFSFGITREWVKESPAHHFPLNPTQSRTRYITEKEYGRLLEGARKGPGYLVAFIELMYLLRARQGEVLALRREDIGADGVHLRRLKGSDSEITLWSERLRGAVRAAQGHNRAVISPWLLHDKRGRQITPNAIRQAFRRAAVRAGLEDVRPHDLKAAGITDHSEHHGGHKSRRAQEVYIRQPDKINPTK